MTFYTLSQNKNNYYSTKLNTFKSEYSMLTSFPLSAKRERSPFKAERTMPTLFKEMGYKSLEFHDYQEDFYSRDVNHVELGFDAFYGSESLDINLFIDNPNFSIPQYIYPLDEELFENHFLIMIQGGGYNAVDGYSIGNIIEAEIANIRNRSHERSRWNDDPYVLHGFRE